MKTLRIAITILALTIFLGKILKSGDGDVRRTDVQTTRTKVVFTTGRDCGSAYWINI